jgi:hypothetical protein
VRKLDRPRIDHTRVADREPILRFRARGRADVDPEVGHLRGLLALFALDEMNRLLADDAHDFALPSKEPQALTNEHLRIPSADGRDERVALVVDVGDDEPDLVDVAGEHDRRRTVGIHLGDAVAGDVAMNGREAFCFLSPHARGRRFES